MKEENLRLRDHDPEELCFYSKATTDFEFLFPFGWGELWGVADRTNYDLTQHQKFSGQDMDYFDQEKNEHYIPYVIEPSLGADRVTLAFLCEAYDEEVVDAAKNDTRVVMHFHPALAPFKCAVLPLSKKLSEPATELYHKLQKRFMCDYDEAGSIGKRYRRQDAIGTPFCVTVDGQTLVNHNRLLRSYDGAVGVKTGYTKTAGRTLVSCAQRGTTQFVCVTLSDPDDWNDHTHLLDWAFENYEYRCVAGDTPVYAVPVLSATVELCAAAPERPAYLLVHPDDQVSLKAELPRFTFAPVEQGTQAGTLTATGPDGQSVTVPLRYAEPAALDPDVKITPLARLGRLWTHACRYFSSYYYPVS